MILETEDWFEPEVVEVDELRAFRSNAVLVGEVRLKDEDEGENTADFDGPPPPPLPPPPSDTVVEAAAEDAKLVVENGVVARDRGDDSRVEAGCCVPV